MKNRTNFINNTASTGIQNPQKVLGSSFPEWVFCWCWLNFYIMKGIMFKEDMFKAVIEGRKTQTRRIVKIDPSFNLIGKGITGFTTFEDSKLNIYGVYPRYDNREVIYLKEPYMLINNIPYYRYNDEKESNGGLLKWKNKMFMPEKYARYFIKITNVRVERLQDISEEDSMTEGISLPNYAEQTITDVRYPEPSAIFQDLWNSINGSESWDINPWVWVYTFELIK